MTLPVGRDDPARHVYALPQRAAEVVGPYKVCAKKHIALVPPLRGLSAEG